MKFLIIMKTDKQTRLEFTLEAGSDLEALEKAENKLTGLIGKTNTHLAKVEEFKKIC